MRAVSDGGKFLGFAALKTLISKLPKIRHSWRARGTTRYSTVRP